MKPRARLASVAAPCSCEMAPVQQAAPVPLPSHAELFPTPEYPPDDWFERPAWLAAGQGLTISDEGQVAGYFYESGACIVHDHAACPMPSPTGYAAFHQQHVRTASGADLLVGVIGNVGGHASPYVDVTTAARKYADPNCQMIVCRAGDDEHGGWIAGALVPGLTHADVALVRRCALSGDWRPMPRTWFRAAGVQPNDPQGYDCIGPTLVNRPGLPLVRAYPRAASAAPVVLGGLGGIQLSGLEEEPVHATLADGTVIDVTPAMVASATVVTPARTAADGPPPPPPPAGDTGTGADDGSTDSAVSREEFDALSQQVSDMSDQLAEVVGWIQDQMAAQTAAIEAQAVPLPETAPVE